MGLGFYITYPPHFSPNQKGHQQPLLLDGSSVLVSSFSSPFKEEVRDIRFILYIGVEYSLFPADIFVYSICKGKHSLLAAGFVNY